MTPLDYRIDPIARVMFTRGWGPLTDAELLEHADRMSLDPHMDPAFDEFVDLREAAIGDVTSVGIRKLADAFRVYQGETPAKIAIVAPDDAVYGMARMYGAFSDDSNLDVGVFRDIDEARVWLGLPREP